jgi:hypothetical protein
MDEKQSVEVRFFGKMLATYIDHTGVCTLYLTPEGLYRVHIEELDEEGGLAWLEGGRLGSGLTAEQVRTLFPEFVHATRESPSTACSCCGRGEGYVQV